MLSPHAAAPASVPGPPTAASTSVLGPPTAAPTSVLGPPTSMPRPVMSCRLGSHSRTPTSARAQGSMPTKKCTLASGGAKSPNADVDLARRASSLTAWGVRNWGVRAQALVDGSMSVGLFLMRKGCTIEGCMQRALVHWTFVNWSVPYAQGVRNWGMLAPDLGWSIVHGSISHTFACQRPTLQLVWHTLGALSLGVCTSTLTGTKGRMAAGASLKQSLEAWMQGRSQKP